MAWFIFPHSLSLLFILDVSSMGAHTCLHTSHYSQREACVHFVWNDPRAKQTFTLFIGFSALVNDNNIYEHCKYCLIF